MPIYRKNPDGSRTRVTYPNGSRSATPASDGATIPAPAPPPTATILQPAPTRRRGHAVKNAQGKFMPTGEGVGFANPPKEHRFDGKPGPGRPRNTLSYDTLIRKHLTKKRQIRAEGKDRVVSTAELIMMATIKDAAEGKGRDARRYALAEIARAFPAQNDSQTVGPRELNASDALTLAEFKAELRQQLLEEIRAGNHVLDANDEGEAL